MGKINLQMSINDMILAMSGGNAGAIMALMRSVEENKETGISKYEEIDPQNRFGPCGLLINLDSMGLYNEQIWMLYNDLCGRSIHNTIVVARAWQLGILNKPQIDQAIERRGGLSFLELVEKVIEKVPCFARS